MRKLMPVFEIFSKTHTHPGKSCFINDLMPAVFKDVDVE
jgi:hypothetical protein